MALSAKWQARVFDLAQELHGEMRAEQGNRSLWGKRFVEIEDEACEVADALADAIMQLSLQEQAENQPEQVARCPGCQRPASREEEPETRLLQTRRGEVGWCEPRYFCPSCRKAFFPSVEGSGD